MKHVITYEGKVQVALGLMQEEYVSLFLPWVNRRIGIGGTFCNLHTRMPMALDGSTGSKETAAKMARM